MARRPNLFLIGAPKSGTTSLYEYLRGHPEIFMSPLKEPFYFSPDVFRGPRGRFRYGQDDAEYLTLFAEAQDERIVGEASTHYLASPQAPALVKAFEPAARIVAILRDPVDMVQAWHNERVLWGTEAETDFARAVASEAIEPGPYTTIAAYGTQLERWLGTFGREAMHIIIFDDLAADTPGEFRRLLQFLEVDAGYQPHSFTAHNQWSQNRCVASYLRSRPLRSASRAMKLIVGNSSARTISRSVRSSRLMRRRATRPPLPPDLRIQLERRFEGEVVRAGELVGRDLAAMWLAGRRLTEANRQRAG